MMIGLDTGFFLELMQGNQDTIHLWESCLDDKLELAVCSLTLFEIERLGLKDKLEHWEVVLEAIEAVALVIWLDRDSLKLAARLSHGLGIPAIDSLILACLVSHGCTDIFTTDGHLEKYQSNKVIVRNLRKP